VKNIDHLFIAVNFLFNFPNKQN